MKKILCLALAAVMVLALCACGGGGEGDKVQETASFQVGFGRTDITPTSPMPMAGYGQTDKRLHQNVLDKIYATCLAITDETGETVLLFHTDLINSSQHLDVRAQVQQATGVPTDHIMLGSTHTHSSVDQLNPKSNGWKGIFVQRCVEAAQAAMEDRTDAEIYIGSAKTEHMNFVRHYLMNDGTYFGDNFGSTASGYKDHASPNDPEVQVVKFVRGTDDDDVKDIILTNFQGHPCITGGIDKTDMSADYIGGTRTYIEYQTKDLFIFFLGASGNQNVKTYLPGEPAPPTDHNAYGMQLGQVIESVLNGEMTKLENTKIHTTEYVFTGEVDHSKDNMVEDAKKVQELYNATDRATGNVLAWELGFTSVYEANGVISKSKMDATVDMPIMAISVGDLAFAVAPYEMFADHGMYIKENSPAKMTIISTCSNGSNGYIPTNLAYDYVCYESTTGKFARGTGDILAEKYVELLTAHTTEG